MNDARELRDPALDAFLGEHSTETPPAHIDAAILAAAHRAVDSSPHPARATQAWRWWMPLAAAAVIGLVVVGVLPLAPSIVAESPPIVSDVPTGAPAAPRQSLQSFMWIRIPEQAERAGDEAPSPVTPPPAARAEGKAAPATRAEGKTAPAAPAKVTAPERKLERARPVPAEVRKDRVLDAPTEAQERPAAAAGAVASAPESPPAPTSGNAASRLARPPELAPQRALSADARDEFDARPHTADEWIARIRALRGRGDVPEAIRALADFRAAFSDADARLPADLREWANAPR